MFQVLLALIVLCVYLLIYYLFGVLFQVIIKNQQSIGRKILYGMFLYGIAFQIFVIPCKFKLVPLTVISRIWFCIILLATVLIVVKFKGQIRIDLKNARDSFKTSKTAWIISTWGLVQILFNEFFSRLPGGNNQVWFVGWPATGVLYNELMTHDTVTGEALKMFPNDRFWSTFLDHSAVVCKLTGLHVMLEVRSVLPAIFILMQVIIIWELSQYIGAGDDKKSLIVFFSYYIVKNIMVGCHLLPGYFSIFRVYEGKGMVASVCLPLLFALLWKMYDKPEKLTLRYKAIISIMGAMTYSFSMMFSVPLVLAAYMPCVIAKKNKKLWGTILLLFMVSGAYVVFYYLGHEGIIDMTIKR